MTTNLADSNPFNVLASTASASASSVVDASPAIDDVNPSINDDAAPDIEQQEEDPTTPEQPEQPEQAKDVEEAQEQSKKDDVDDNMMESQKTSSLMHSLTRDKAADAAEGVKPFVYLVAVTAALGGLIFGYDIGGAGELYMFGIVYPLLLLIIFIYLSILF